jgi:hypothetical protein
MILKFEPERVVYDRAEGMMRFYAFDGPERIRCAVSIWALAALEEAALASPEAMATTYRENRSVIQEIAEHKYRTTQLEAGAVVVHVTDVATLALQRRAQGSNLLKHF